MSSAMHFFFRVIIFFCSMYNKTIITFGFVFSCFISRSLWLQLITSTSTWLSQKTSYNNCIIAWFKLTLLMEMKIWDLKCGNIFSLFHLINTYSSTKFSSFQISAGYNAKVQEVSTIDQPKKPVHRSISQSTYVILRTSFLRTFLFK